MIIPSVWESLKPCVREVMAKELENSVWKQLKYPANIDAGKAVDELEESVRKKVQ